MPAAKVGESTVADLQQVIGDLSPTELEKFKVALDEASIAARKKQARRRVKCGGKTFAPFGLRNDLPDEDPPVMKEMPPYKKDSLPEKVDLRKYMSEVEDQAQSNSCCANAIVGAYEYILTRSAQATGTEFTDMSRLFVYYVGRKKDMEMDRRMFRYQRQEDAAKQAPKDEGMTVQAAISAVQSKGVCLAASWPYDLEKVNEKPTEECFKEALKHTVLQCHKVRVDVDDMRRCLAQGNPIVCGLMLTDRFFRPGPGGFIPTPGENDPRAAQHGLHALLIVGYNDRQQVFIVRNSWGAWWGDNGYCYLNYDYAGSPVFNACFQYAITAVQGVDFTPDPDDGVDANLEDNGEDPEIEEEEVDEEEDVEDGWDFSEEFKGDKLVRELFIGNDGVLPHTSFEMMMLNFAKREAGKTFNYFEFAQWMYAPEQYDKNDWTPKDFQEVVTKFVKEDFATKFPGLAFLKDDPLLNQGGVFSPYAM